MLVRKTETQRITAEEDIVRVRQTTKKLAMECGFNVVECTKMTTAASELARNVFRFAEDGTVTFEILQDAKRQGLRVTFEDSGPGIGDVDQAMMDGYSSGGGLGLGLGGAKRLVNEFSIQSKVNHGTTVVITRWK